MTNNFNWLN